MGSIVQRKRKDGTTAYLAQIALKSGGKVYHRENKTFKDRRLAAGWIGRRELEIATAKGDAILNDPPLHAVIDTYTASSQRGIGRTKAQTLAYWKASALARKRCSKITSADIVQASSALLDGNRKPQTVASYLSHLAAIFAVARPAWGYPLDQQAMKDAFVVCKRMGFTSKSKPRSRRPTLDELDAIMTHFGKVRAHRIDSVPMQAIIAFALFSTRRMEEITRITWADLDAKHSRIMVRDMKHPGDKIGNDQWVDLPAPALAIIQAQPKRSDRIFPYSTDAIGAAFTRAGHVLSIDDLHFHDLRHEGVSRLFEMGLSIPHVAAVSGHRSWSSLQRYTHIRAHGDKYDCWKWLPVVTGQRPALRVVTA